MQKRIKIDFKLLAMDMIVEALKEKACLKQDVFERTKKEFVTLTKLLEEKVRFIDGKLHSFDQRVHMDFIDNGDMEVQASVGGDRIIFHMHSNIFKFDANNSLWKTSYLSQDDKRAYCGIINVYNFLNDSFKFNRLNDLGYLVARIFINYEGHYFVQGKRQLGFLYNDFINEVISDKKISAIIDSVLLYSIDFDLLVPPYRHVQEATVSQIQEITSYDQLKTGKRLGFKFQADSDEII